MALTCGAGGSTTLETVEQINENTTNVIKAVSSIDLVSDLIGLDATIKAVNVKGYHSINDGGGDLFNWDSTIDKSTANGVRFFDPSVSLEDQGTGVGFGCWVRQYNGYINGKSSGAKLDGTTDDTIAIQKILDLSESDYPKLHIKFIGNGCKITRQLDLSRSNVVIDFHCDFTGDFGTSLQSLFYTSSLPQAPDATSYTEPTTFLENIEFNLHESKLDWGIDGTSFVYDYGDVKNYWQYHVLFFDKVKGLKINNGKGLLTRGLVSNLFTRKVQNGVFDDIEVTDSVWDNGFTINTVLTRDLDNPLTYNSCVVNRCIAHGNASYGMGTYNVLDVIFNDCLAYSNGGGFHAETPEVDRDKNSLIKFNNCKSIANIVDDTLIRKKRGFYIDAKGTKLNNCYASANDINVVVSVSEDVVIDGVFLDSISDNIYISQNHATLQNSVMITEKTIVKNGGNHGIHARGVNILTIQDGCQIIDNAETGIYVNNNGALYNQGNGNIFINKAFVNGNNVQTRIEYIYAVYYQGTHMKTGISIASINRNNNIVSIDYPFVFGNGVDEPFGIEISTTALSIFTGMYSDLNSPIADSATIKKGLTREGLADASGWTDSTAQANFNNLLAKLRTGGILDKL